MNYCIYCGQRLNGERRCPNPECAKPIPGMHPERFETDRQFEKSGKYGRSATETAADAAEDFLKNQAESDSEENREAANLSRTENTIQKRAGKKKKKPVAAVVCIAAVAVAALVWVSTRQNTGLVNSSLFDSGVSSSDGVVYEEAEETDAPLALSSERVTFTSSAETAEVTAILTDLEGEATWSTADATVAVVSWSGNTGTIRPVAQGETQILVTCGDYTVSCTVVCDFSDINTYEIIVEDCTWEEAWESCLEMGGHLLTINSHEEYEAVVAQIEAENLENIVYYLGARRWDDGTYYRWLDAEGNMIGPVLNSDSDLWYADCWLDGEPSFMDGDTEEKYLEMFYYSSEDRWVWNDGPNDITSYYSGKTGYICEYVE